MNVTIFGSGYVGLVTGACLAEVGNQVLCVDIDPVRVERLRAGEVPIFEPGLPEMVERGLESGRLAFSTDLAAGVHHGEVLFVAVGTPQAPQWEPFGEGATHLPPQSVSPAAQVVVPGTQRVATHTVPWGQGGAPVCGRCAR